MTMKKILLITLLSFVCFVSNAVTYYWVGLSATGSFDDGANWSITSGGAGGTVRPTSSDMIVLDKTAVISLPTGISVSSITVKANAGFKPVSNASITANTVIIDAGFTFTLNAVGGSGTTLTVTTISVGGTLDLSAGGGVCDLTVKGGLFGGSIKRSENGGTYSKIRFTGTSQQTFSASLDPNSKIDVTVDNINNVSMGSDINIPGTLTLVSGKLIVNNYNLSIKNDFTGNYSAGKYVVLNNTSGSLKLQNIGDDRPNIDPFLSVFKGKIFHVGVSTTSADPIYIANNQGIDVFNDFTVKLKAGVPTGAANPNQVYQREWDISTTSNNANIELESSVLGKPVGFVSGSKVIGHFVGGIWVEKTAVEGTAYGLAYSANFTSFSPFAVGNASGFLPVALTFFKANKKQNTNLLNWQTASEKNNSHFDIERSITGQGDWAKLGTVKGNGNSQIIRDYVFTDNTPLSISYYRLKQVDIDGGFEYSNVVSVTTKGDKFKINALYPNPTKDNIAIQFESNKNEVVNVSVMDLTGRVVLTQNASITEWVNSLNVNTAFLSSGIYMVSLKNSESIIVNKIVKN